MLQTNGPAAGSGPTSCPVWSIRPAENQEPPTSFGAAAAGVQGGNPSGPDGSL